jgi:hypothetical protein
MSTSNKRVMKLALEALNRTESDCGSRAWEREQEAIKALEEVLASEQRSVSEQLGEPVVGTKTWFEDGKVVTQNLYHSDVYTTPQPKQEQRSDSEHTGEPVAWESVLGAVARGWCYEDNANKTMDSELAVAIAKEVHALYTTPQQPSTVVRKPQNWSVFNTGAEVASGLTFDESCDYLTDERLARGWSAVCVVNKDNLPIEAAHCIKE